LPPVEFFKTLPAIDDPMLLRGPDFQLPTQMSPDQWLTQLQKRWRRNTSSSRTTLHERLRGGVHLADDHHRSAKISQSHVAAVVTTDYPEFSTDGRSPSSVS
jgi:hypothetical protein